MKTKKTFLTVLFTALAVAVGLVAPLGITIRPSLGSDPASGAVSANLINKHEKKGIQCAVCHGTQSVKKSVPKETCIGCHGSYDILSKKSRIHEAMLSPHFEDGTGCALCHNIHKPSRLLCGQCHNIDTKVP
jgi:fumarate reductase flavoprotein subunit